MDDQDQDRAARPGYGPGVEPLLWCDFTFIPETVAVPPADPRHNAQEVSPITLKRKRISAAKIRWIVRQGGGVPEKQ
jgi:hypothetical protein